MSLWWVKKDQLDDEQLKLIEELPHHQNFLVLGPPGSGKTNVLLRRAQFVRSQGFPNVMVLAFTRALTEFVKTGCYSPTGDEIFPRALVSTLEKWIRYLYREHGIEIPDDPSAEFGKRKADLALGAIQFASEGKLPKYDILFVDEAQDLMNEEVELLSAWSKNIFFVGDSRQKIYGYSSGLSAAVSKVPAENQKELLFHYRIAPEICAVADRILRSSGDESLAKNEHYNGPKPGRVRSFGPSSKADQLDKCCDRLVEQVRVYADFIAQGDRLGVVVAYADDRELVLDRLENDSRLAGLGQIVRAWSGDKGDDHDPKIDDTKPIFIMTTKGVKGLEFRAVHWLFCDDLQAYHTNELYYTVVTRAKTSLDFYHSNDLPATLARSHSNSGGERW